MSNLLVTENFKTGSKGLLFYIPESGVFKENKKSKGFGSIKYCDGSIYTGDLVYDETGFHKLGYGRQCFAESINTPYMERDGKKYKFELFVGQFDYRKTDWIYGNGILYFRDESGNPIYFQKGFFKGLQKIDEWKGKFNPGILASDFRPEMEITEFTILFDYTKKFNEYCETLIDKNKNYDLLLIGDSYMDLLREDTYTGHCFEKEFKNSKNVLNLAVGGTTFDHWFDFVKSEKFVLKSSPKVIYINLGFNDMHSGTTSRKLCKNLRDFTLVLKEKFPKSRLVYTTICLAPAFISNKQNEDKYNNYLRKNYKDLGVDFIDFNKLIAESTGEVFNNDIIHPGKDGYTVFIRELSNLME